MEVVIKYLIALIVFAVIFLLLYISAMTGQMLGKRQMANHPKRKLRILGVAEGAVFALLGLLVAFSFSGAYDRFESRKVKIMDEANAIYTAYLRLDLLTPSMQEPLREKFREYINARMAIYDDLSITHFSVIDSKAESTLHLQHVIWDQAILALAKTNNGTATDLLLTSLNMMFEASNSQYIMSKLHPPAAVFALLMLISILSAFLTGYTTAQKKYRNKVYIISYLIVITITLYITFDLELPRLGLIRVSAFDLVIVNINQNFYEGKTLSLNSK